MFILAGEAATSAANNIAFCADTAKIWGVIGYIVLAVKIVIPLLLIIFGMLDLGKAVISSEEKAIKTATNTLIKRFIAAVVIFFIPTIVNGIFSLLQVLKPGEAADYNNCVECVTNVTGTKCKNLMNSAEENPGITVKEEG